MKNILITHTDLDGAGCAIVFKKNIPGIEIEFHDYKTINQRANELFEKKEEYEKIYFADITPDEEIGLKMIKDDKFILIDHHKTRSYLFGTKYFNTELSGAFLSAMYFMEGQESPSFIMAVDAWDTWKLDSKYRSFGEDLNILFGYYGMEKFISIFKDMPSFLTEFQSTIVQIANKIKQDYLKHKISQMEKKTDEEGNIYYEFHIGESQSGLGNITEMFDMGDAKYIKAININDGVVSLYSKTFDVSNIAKKNGGGGHPGASGYTLKK